jgi:dCMP deaminase
MTRPSIHTTLTRIAFEMAERSTCSRQHNGAIIAREGRILSSGYNGVPRGMTHCVHDEGDRSETDDSNRRTGCPLSVHAEANAVAFAARSGVALDQAVMYVTTAPCLACAQLIINAGIFEVIAAREYRLADGVTLLRQAHVPVSFIDLEADEIVSNL